MTQAEFYYKSEGWKRQYRDRWERTRLICYHSALSALDRKKIPGIKKFMPFEWDEEQKDDSVFHRLIAKKKKLKEQGII